MPDKMNGGELQAKVIELAGFNGWRIAHFRSVKTSVRGGGFRYMTPVAADGKGFPDLLLVNPERHVLMFREMKGPYEPLSPEQQNWGDWLTEAGQDWDVWRPKHWPDIVNTLTFGRGSAQ
jgi:hypothetical protein